MPSQFPGRLALVFQHGFKEGADIQWLPRAFPGEFDSICIHTIECLFPGELGYEGGCAFGTNGNTIEVITPLLVLARKWGDAAGMTMVAVWRSTERMFKQAGYFPIRSVVQRSEAARAAAPSRTPSASS